jgi:hypothetical protein
MIEGKEILNLSISGSEKVEYLDFQQSLDLCVSSGELDITWREDGDKIKLSAGMAYEINTRKPFKTLNLEGTGQIQIVGRG